MYTPVCPDIFHGATEKARSKVDEYGLTPLETESVKSISAMTADYCWLLVALAKHFSGQDLHEVIKEKWEAVSAQVERELPNIDFDKHSYKALTFYYGTVLQVFDRFLSCVMENVDERADNAYHPYGFLWYMNFSLRTSWDFYLALTESDLDDREWFRSKTTEALQMVERIATLEYEELTGLRREVVSRTEDIPGLPNDTTFAKMFTNTMSLKEFRNHLAVIADMSSLASVSSKSQGSMRELLEKIAASGNIEILSLGPEGGRHSTNYKVPEDLDKMFDDA